MRRQDLTFFSCLEGFMHSCEGQTFYGFFFPLFNESLSLREEPRQLQNCAVHGDLRNRSISCYGSARNYMRGIFSSLKLVCLVPTAPSGLQLTVHGGFLFMS